MDEKIIRLKNGVEVLTAPNENLHSAAFALIIPAGAAYESAGTLGISHFTEHLLFKRAGEIGQAELYRRMTALGINVEGMTTHRNIIVYFKSRRECLVSGMRLVSEMIFGGGYTGQDLEEELRTVLAEMFEKDASDSPAARLTNSLWSDGPRTSILGRAEDLEALTPYDIEAFLSRVLTARCKAILCGDFGSDELASLETLFGRPLPAPAPAERVCRGQEGRDMLEFVGNAHDEAEFITAYHLTGIDERDKFGIELLNGALFDGIDAYYLEFLRGRGHSIYSAESNFYIEDDELILFYSQLCPPEKLPVCLADARLFEKKAPGFAYRDMARPFFVDNLVFLCDDTEDLLLSYFDDFEATGRLVTLDERRAAVSGMEDDYLRALAARVFSAEKRITVCGKLPGKIRRLARAAAEGAFDEED